MSLRGILSTSTQKLVSASYKLAVQTDWVQMSWSLAVVVVGGVVGREGAVGV